MVEAAKAAGRPGDDHVVVTLHGGSTDQITLPTTLDGLVAAVKSVRAPAADPVHVIMGAAAEQRLELSWYETKPLFGWRVLVPRTKDQAAPMVARLRTYGAHSEEVPTISVEPPRSPLQMDKAIRGLVEGRYEWVAFTSVNAVKAVREKFEEYGLDARAFSGLKVAAVGEVTAQALQAWGIEPDLVPKGEQSAAGLAAEFPPYDEVLDPINRVFLPRADIATETLAAGLKALGWEVEDVTAYRTVRATPPPAPVREAIKTGKFDAVVFTSSSTVRNLVGIAGKPHPSTIIAVIGPATARTCEEHGLRVDVVAAKPSVVDLADALASFRRRPGATGSWPTASRCSGRRRRSPPPPAGLERTACAPELVALCPEPRRRVIEASTSSARMTSRPRRLRTSPVMRAMVAETSVEPRQLILPLFVAEGLTEPRPICSMPGVVQHTLDTLRKAAVEAARAGLAGVMLFGVPEAKDAAGVRCPRS